MEPTQPNRSLRMTCVLTLALILLASSNLFSQLQIQSSGDWNDPSIWEAGVVPTSSDNVEIIGNFQVIVSSDAVCNNLTIQAQYAHNRAAKLIVSNGAQLNVQGSLQMDDQSRNNNSVSVLINEASELHVNGNVVMLKDGSNSSNNDMFIQLDDNNSLLSVIGDINMNFDLSSNNSNNFGLVLNQNSTIIAENINFTMAGGHEQYNKLIQVNHLGLANDSATLQVNNNFDVDISGGYDMWMNIDGKGLLDIGNNFNINTTAGRSIKLILNHDAQVNVVNDFLITENSNGYFYIENNNLSNTGASYEEEANAKLSVGGDLTINKTDGDEFRIYLEESSMIEVGGDFNLNVSNTDDSSDNLILRFRDNSQLKVDGSINIIQDEQNRNPDLLIDIEDNALVKTGEDLNITLNKADIADIDIIENGSLVVGRDFTFSNNDGGNYFQLDMDNNGTMAVAQDMFVNALSGGAAYFHLDGDASLTVGDSLLINKATNNDIEIYLNKYADGSESDAQLHVQGDFIMNKVVGPVDYMRIQLYKDANLKVDGDMKYTTDNETDYGKYSRIYIYDDSDFEIGGNFMVSMNNTQNNPDFSIYLYNDADFIVGSSFDFNSTAGDLWVKLYNTSNMAIGESWTTDFTNAYRFHIDYFDNAEIEIQGDFNFTKNSGSGSLELDLDYDNKLIVGGDMNIINKGTNGTLLHLERDAQLNIAGDLNIAKENNGWVQILLNYNAEGDENDVKLDIGGDFNIEKTGDGNDYLQLFMKRDAELNIAGNLNITTSKEESDNRYSQIKLQHNAKLEVGGLVDIKMLEGVKNPDFYINLYNDAQFNIDSSFSMNSVAGDFWVYLENNSKLTAASWSSDLSKAERNYLRIQHDASFEIENDFSALKTEGSGYFYLDLNHNANVSIGNEFDVNYTGTEAFYVYLDNDATMSTGNFIVNYDGNSQAKVMLNTSADGSENDAQLTVNGDFTFNKTNGSDYYLYLYRDADLNITGNMTVDYGNSISTSKAYIYIKHQSKINTLGTANLTLNNVNQENNDFRLRLYDDAQFNIGNALNPSETSLNLNLTRGRHFQVILFDDGIMNVYGDMNMAKIGGENLEVYLNYYNSGGQEPRLNVIGDLDIDNFENSDRIYLRVRKSAVLDVDGNVDFLNVTGSERAELALTSTGALSIGGEFLRNEMPNRFGKLNSLDNSTIIFDGDSPQKIASNEGDGNDSFIYKNIVLNNSYDDEAPFVLEGSITIPYNMSLNFMDGIVNTNNDSLFVIADEATVSGASDASHVNGPVTKIGNNPFEFPVGKESEFRPISISAPSHNSDAYRASYLKSNPLVFGTDADPSIAHVSSSEYWGLDRLVGDSDVNITLSWDAATSGEVTNIDELAIVGFDGEKWVDYGSDAITGDVSQGTISTNSSVVLFNPFTLASRNAESNSLPVELLGFEAKVVGNVVELNWSTATEINNDYFMVERTQDGYIFEDVVMIEGNGNSNEKIDYKALDLNPMEGVSYYRLKQQDFDGKFEYSDLRQVVFTSAEESFDNISELSIYPNPIKRREILTVELYDYSRYEKVTLFITNAQGNTIQSQEIPTLGKQMIYFQVNANYFPGIYFVNVHTDKGVDTKRLVIK